ncbi:hypothetical protein M3182_22190 [Mesobacillus maritimus]|uniref:hypothetical protein n=1 Tax=Mesobacillus maritimus TaxID=1643336 RepID=UPI00203E9930|nr:hypothetical protein [Mesobacillus maritimus]MCM3588391.1 hypothetical protein [Mesobacillus maritimus]MCM3672025.1 hypothetical protein [Mesobacillus maritimus]
MPGYWNTIFLVQAFIWLIVLFEWKRMKNISKADKITIAAILVLSAMMSFLKVENVPGPITLLHYIFGPLGKLME